MQRLIDAENSDLFDVEYVSFAVKPISRELRVAHSVLIFAPLNQGRSGFGLFSLSTSNPASKRWMTKNCQICLSWYQAIVDAMEKLGKERNAICLLDFKNLYASEIG